MVLDIEVWVVHYSNGSYVKIFPTKASALDDIRKSRGMEQNTTEHGTELVLHYERNYNVRLYPRKIEKVI